MRVVVQRGEKVFIGRPDVRHPLQDVLRRLVVQDVIHEGPGGSDVGGALGDEEASRHRRLLDGGHVILVVPYELGPVSWASEKRKQGRLSRPRCITCYFKGSI